MTVWCLCVEDSGVHGTKAQMAIGRCNRAQWERSFKEGVFIQRAVGRHGEEGRSKLGNDVGRWLL